MRPSTHGRTPARAAAALVVAGLALLPALRAMAAAADRMQAGEAVFAPPDGWAVKEQANGVVKIVSPDENAMILVMPADRFDGDLEQGFAATWEALRKGLEVEEVGGGKPSTGETDGGYESVMAVTTLRDKNDNPLKCEYSLLRNGDAVCALAYVASARHYNKYEPAYDELANSFVLGGKRSKPAKAVPPPHGKPDPQEAEKDADAEGVQDAPAKKAGKPAPEPPALQPDTVAGRVTDARGNVIENAKLTVELSGTTIRGGERTSLRLEVDENGLYEQEVPNGLYRIYGTIETEYNGHKYRLPLHPEDNKEIGTSQSSKKGIIKNYVWKLNGLKPGSSKELPNAYYGGTVRLGDAQQFNEGRRLADRYPGAKVVVILKPRGPLIDGSQGKPVKIEAPVESLRSDPQFMDIAIGRYTATATLTGVRGGREAPLKMSVRYMGSGITDAPYVRTADIEFVQPSVFEDVRQVYMVLSE